MTARWNRRLAVDHVLVVAHGGGQPVQLLQLRLGDPGGGPFGGLAGQGGQDGEVVDGVLGGDPDDGDAAPGGDRHQSLVGQFEQGLAYRGPADAELPGDLVEVEAVAGPELPGEHPVPQLPGGARTGPSPLSI